MSEDGRGFGAQLRSCRLAAGLSQEELAQRSGLSGRAIANLERGQARWPHRETLNRLAGALELRDAARAEFIGAAGRRLAAVAAGAESHRAGSGQLVPRQLPAPVRGFTGREGELAALTALLGQAGSQARAAMVISVVCGMAGVGKTALVVNWAHQIAGDFPDGQLYVNLRGYDVDQPTPAAEALAVLLHGLGMAGPSIPAGVSERGGAYRSLLAGRRVLVVLDNARDTEQVRPLLPGSPTCAVVVTSRNALAGLVARDGASRLELGLLPLPEAVAVLEALLGPRAQAEPAAVTRMATQCCRLPLALRVAAELAAACPDVRLADLAAELDSLQRRLDLLAADGDSRTAVRAVLSWSCRHLDPGEARTFCLAGLHPGQDFDTGAAAALAGVAPEAASRQVGRLARAYLIQPAAPGRYRMHDLLRAYARELAAEHGAEQHRAALTRLFDYYLRTTTNATAVLFPARCRQDRGVPPDAAAVLAGDRAAARAWLDSETGNFTAIVAYMTDHGWSGDATRLAAAVFPYLETFGRTTEAVAICSRALQAARIISDRDAEATALGNLGYTCLQQGRYQQAARHLRQAVTLFRQTGNQPGEAHALSNLAVVDRRQGRYQQAARHQQQAVALHRQAGDQWGEAVALTRLGGVEYREGLLPQAGEHIRQALILSRQLGDQVSQAEALTRLGVVESRQGRHQHAARHHQLAVTLFRQNDDQLGEAEALNGLGEAMLEMSHPSRARSHHGDALRLARQTGDQDQQARAYHGLARAHLATGQAGHACHHLREALTIYTTLSSPEADQIRSELHACQEISELG